MFNNLLNEFIQELDNLDIKINKNILNIREREIKKS